MSLITSIIGGASGGASGGGTSGPGNTDETNSNNDGANSSQETGDQNSGGASSAGGTNGNGGATAETTQSGNRIPSIRESISVTASADARSGGDGAIDDAASRLDLAFSPVISEEQARQLAEAARERTEQQSLVDSVAEGQKKASERFEASVDEVREASEPPADNRIDRAA